MSDTISSLVDHPKLLEAKELMDAQLAISFAHYLFFKVFYFDMVKLGLMEGLWTDGRKPPAPFVLDDILNETKTVKVTQEFQGDKLIEDQKVHTLKQNALLFLEV